MAQLQQGAKADVLATADRPTMTAASRPGLTTAPVVFARNTLAIVVGKGNPRHVAGPTDLSEPGLRVVLAAPAVPAGRYAGQALESAGVSVHPVSLEDNVEGVLSKVGLGEADAGIVYATDARASPQVGTVAIPDRDNVTTEYLVAETKTASDRAGADAFIAFLRSPAAQAELRRLGFQSP